MTAKARKTRKADKGNASSPFWKPQEEGDFIKGKFVRWEQSQYGVVLALDTGKVGLSNIVLRDTFSSIFDRVKVNDEITIQYEGLNKQTKLFNVFWKGKKVERKGMGAPASREEVQDFFSHMPEPRKKKKGARK